MSDNQGQLIGIAFRLGSRKPMQEVDRTTISPEGGVTNDFRGKPGRRQVTVLALEDWDAACAEVGKDLHWTTRRANLFVSGIALNQTTGSRIVLGDVCLEVTGETDPCSRMDQAQAGLSDALTPNWRGGVCCRVIRGGEIETGMAVQKEPPGIE